MTTFAGALGPYFTLYLDVTLNSQSIEDNTSSVHWVLRIVNTGGRRTSYRLDNDSPWSINVGTVSSGTTAYDFRSTTSMVVASGNKTIAHDSDGSKSLSVSASFSAAGGTSLGSGSLSGTYVLPTIPRASTPTFSVPEIDAGESITITTNRADDSFTHTIEYAIGSATGTVATGVGASTAWLVPMSLLNQIPNSLSGTINITTTTFSGATEIGTSVTSFVVKVPSSVVPDFTTITNSENVTAVATIVGAYVQTLTKLALAITGATGAYGSTITGYKIEVNGQVINAISGVTPNPITAQGTVVITGTITDSRGRTKVKTVNITVLPYSPPGVVSASTQRALVTGTPDDEGTYIRADLDVAVASLVVSSVEKNTLTYKISTRLYGTSTWTLKKTVTPTGVSFDGYDTVGTYLITDSYDVLIQISDQFATTALIFTISTATIFMDWNGTEGVGILKYHEQGALDVNGQIYQNNGKAVLDQDDIVPDATTSVKGIVELATNAETQTGSDSTRAVTPAGLTARTATTSRMGIAELATEAEARAGDTSRIVTGQTLLAVVGMVKLFEQDFVSDDIWDLDNVLSSSFKRHKVIIEVPSLASVGSLFMWFRAGGVTKDDTNYRYTRDYGFSSSPAAPSNVGASRFEIAGGTSSGHFCELTIFNAAVSGEYPVILGITSSLSSSGTPIPTQTAGWYINAAIVDGMRFTSTGGGGINMNGRVAIYGLN